ncbi:MAG: SGNH/GDSL hydrolase family protein [Sphingomonas sp.]
MSGATRMLSPSLRAAAIALFAMAPACAQNSAGPARFPVHVGGRVAVETDGSMRFGWPGVYIEGRFKGTGLSVVLENGQDRLRLLIDGVEVKRFEEIGAKVDSRIEGLSDGEHRFRLEKLAETQGSSSRLIGFYPINGAQPLPASPGKARQIEFIGDSWTVGYGNTATGRTCTSEEVHNTTDTQQAYGARVARHFDADYRINAFSGFGIARNYGGSSAGLNLPAIYPRLIPSAPTPLESSAGDWHPQIIVINLGTNDFSTPVHAGEAWPDDKALRTAYRTRYIDFARGILANKPGARLILMGSDNFIADVDQVAAALRETAPGRVSTIHMSGLELTGCDWHPSLKDDQHLADLVQAEIGRIHAPAPWQ